MLTNRGSTIRECGLVLFVERASELRDVARLSHWSDAAEGRPSLNRAKVAWCRPETGRSIHEQVEAVVRHRGGPNHVAVEKAWDELWIAEKFQSNSEIAGSPRNSFRASLKVRYTGVEH